MHCSLCAQCARSRTWTWTFFRTFCVNLAQHVWSWWVRQAQVEYPQMLSWGVHLQCRVSSDVQLQLRSLCAPSFSLSLPLSLFCVWQCLTSNLRSNYVFTFTLDFLSINVTAFYVLFLWHLLSRGKNNNFFKVWVQCGAVLRFLVQSFLSSKMFFSVSVISVCTQHCSLMLFKWGIKGQLTMLIGKNSHTLSTYQDMAFISIRTQMQTILQLKNASWIWNGVFLGNF